MTLLPSVYSWGFLRPLIVNKAAGISWAVAFSTLAFLIFARDKLLPSATLVFTHDLGFVRRYGAEIGLVLGIVSLVASIIMWIYPFAG
jgi:hypothetical protein